jgi:peptide-methionine (R)-S-oxide reductase
MKYNIILFVFLACNTAQKAPNTASVTTAAKETPALTAMPDIIPAVFDAQGRLQLVQKEAAEWRKILNEQEYTVLREEGTERSFTGDLYDHHAKGIYTCRGCHLPLFDSKTKFESGTGWPSFYQSIDKAYVKENSDTSYGMTRIEVECARCGGHLGHVFDDGPRPTGLRYCINSVSLDFAAQQ